jgi:hypothetical protein
VVVIGGSDSDARGDSPGEAVTSIASGAVRALAFHMAEHVVDRVLEEFCCDYLMDPYTQYTEHGVHAYFFSKLYAALPAQDRYVELPAHGRICRIQKEYPTPGDLGKSRRQGWDICLLRTPASYSSTDDSRPVFDRLDTEAIIEFGLNAGEPHLTEDVRRLAHEHVRADLRYVVHLIRTSGPSDSAKRSRRDASSEDKRTKAFRELQWIRDCLGSPLVKRAGVTVFVVWANTNERHVRRLTSGEEHELRRPIPGHAAEAASGGSQARWVLVDSTGGLLCCADEDPA